MTTWVLLRGLTRETRHWGRLPDLLGGMPGGDRVLRVDLPGNGEYAGLRAPGAVAEMVGFVRLAALQSGAGAPFSLVAMSLGGMVATAWAQRHPHDIDRLVLINTSMRPFSRATERLRPEAWPTLLKVAAHWRDAPRAEAGIHRVTCNDLQTQAGDIAAWSAIRHSAPVSRANALRQLWAAARFDAGPQAPRCPALILSSQGDRLVNPACSAKVAAAWGATHARHPWAGHDVPHDDPDWVVAQVREWVVRST